MKLANDKPIGSIKLGVSLDGQNFGNTLDDITRQLKVAESALKTNLKAFDNAQKSVDGLAQKQKDLSVVSEGYDKKVQALTERLKQQESAENRNEKAIANTKKQLNDAIAKQNAYSNQLADTKKELIYAENGVNDLSQALKENERAMNNEVKALKEAGDKTGSFEAKQKGLAKQSDLLKQSIKAQERVVDELGKEFGENSTQTERAKNALQSFKNQSSITEKQLSALKNEANRTDDSIRKIGDESEKSGQKLGSLREKLSFGAVAGLAKRGVDSLVSSISNMMGEVTDASDSMDKFKSTMKFAGFNQAEIDASAKAVKDYADKTVYDLGDVSNTTAQLGANGVKDFAKLTEAAGNLNAVAGGNADTFKSVGMVMTQTAGAGKLTTENWNQLADAVPGASGRLQEAMLKNGAYTGDFRDAMAKGQITADEFNKAIMDLGMEDAAKEAASSTSTFEGAMGNLQAQVVSSLNDIIGAFGKENITAVITSISDKIAEATPKIKQFIQSALDKLNEIKDWLSQYKPLFDNLKDAVISLAKDGFDKLKEALGWVIDKFNEFSDWKEKHPKLFESLAIVVGSLATSLGIVATAMGIYTAVTTIATAVTGAFTAVMAVLTSPITLVVLAIGALIAVGVLLYKNWDVIKAKALELWNKLVEIFENIKNSIAQKWDSMKAKAVEVWDNIKSSVTNKVSEMGSRVGEFIDKTVGWFRDLPHRIASGISAGSTAVRNAFSGLFDGAKKAIAVPVNGIISGANWILSKFGANEIPKWNAYESGTAEGGHKGGNALVNDGSGSNYKEMVITPQGQAFIPQSRNVFIPQMPKGTHVLNADETKQIMHSNGIKRYAKGTGLFSKIGDMIGDVWDFVSDPSKLVKSVIDKFVGFGNASHIALDMGKGLVKKATSAMFGWVKKLFDTESPKVKYNASAGVEQWHSVAIQALKMEGQYTPANLNALLYQMQTESGGNPNAINNWDINARNGVPSQGLLQVIPPTFRAYARPGYDKSLTDPLSNILASIRYAVSRYGSLTRAYRGVGYANGGIITREHLAMVGEGNKPEVVIPLDKAKRSRAMQLLAKTKDLLGINDNVIVTSNNNNNDNTQIISLLTQQNNLLMQLLAKDTNVYMDAKKINKTLSEVESQSLRQQQRNAGFAF